MGESEKKLSQNGHNGVFHDKGKSGELSNLSSEEENGKHNGLSGLDGKEETTKHDGLEHLERLNEIEETEKRSDLDGEETGKRSVVSWKKEVLSSGPKLASLIDNSSNRANRVALSVPLPNERLKERTFTDSSIPRRTRVNRLIIRKRLNERYRHRITSRLMVVAVVMVIVLFSLLSSGVGVVYAYYRSQLPLLNGIATHSLFQSTHIYDRNGQLLYVLYNHQDGYGRRTYVNYSDIPQVLINATIASEDHTFWTNSGIDVQGTIRAAITDVQNRAAVEGGSTVTQQLVKNQLFLTQPRSLQVKAEEALLAFGLTQQYPKWKIMEMYLNTVFYGDINYGVEAAAQDFFNLQPQCSKHVCKPGVSQLDLAQATMLAGLPQSPSYYNPIYGKSQALERQKSVLQSMMNLSMITPTQAQQAETEMAKYNFKSYSNAVPNQAPHFVQYLIDQVLVPLLGSQNLLDGGYNIYTTLDLNLEKKVEQIVYDHLYKVQHDPFLGTYGPLDTINNVNNGAVVVMDPHTGEILAMDGSANYNDRRPQVQGQFNAAISLRQPGSSFKPIVYSAAFEMGWYPAMIVPNHKTTYPASGNPPSYTPNNYGNVFLSGFPMTIRNAIANSINIPAIDAIEYAGISNVVNLCARLGLTEISKQPAALLGPSMAIGTKEVSLLDLTSAYSTFANQGTRVPPVSVLEITDNQGHPIYTYDAAHPHGYQAIRPDVAFLMNSILSDKAARYHEFYPGNPLELDRPVAAKTGTTDQFRDNWTMGYTPYLTTGVWVGNSDNTPMNHVIGITGAGPIWHDVMDYASQHYKFPPDDFIRPSDVHQGVVSAYSGLLPHSGEAVVTDWFIDGTLPTIAGSNSYVPPSPPPTCKGDKCKPPCTNNCGPPTPNPTPSPH